MLETMSQSARLQLPAVAQKTALHLNLTAPQAPQVPRGQRNALIAALLVTLGLPLLVLVSYAGQSWAQLEALYLLLPCGLLSFMLAVNLRSQFLHQREVAEQVFATQLLEPALLLTGVALKPSEAVRFLTRGVTTLDPADNLYKAFRMTKAIDREGQLIAVLSH
jgi:hypothetical protein